MVYEITRQDGGIMSIAAKIKGLLASSGKDNAGHAQALGISSQALSNKFNRGSFSVNALLIVAEYTGYELMFVSANGSRVVLDDADRKDT